MIICCRNDVRPKRSCLIFCTIFKDIFRNLRFFLILHDRICFFIILCWSKLLLKPFTCLYPQIGLISKLSIGALDTKISSFKFSLEATGPLSRQPWGKDKPCLNYRYFSLSKLPGLFKSYNIFGSFINGTIPIQIS